MPPSPMTDELLAEALRQAPGTIVITDGDGVIIYVSRAEHGPAIDQTVGTKLGHDQPFEARRRIEVVLARVRATGRPESFEHAIAAPSGERRWYTNQYSRYETSSGARGLICIITDVTHRKLAELRLESLRGEIIEASHRAGMAEVATGVLHSVGNVLNSVNVAAEVLAEELERSRFHLLRRAVTMIQDHEDRVVELLTRDPKGRKLPALLARLCQELEGEHERLHAELTRLRRHIELVRSIVEAQQSLAKLGSMAAPTELDVLVHETLSMFQLELESRSIELELTLDDVGRVVLDKQATQQILANLVRNAIDAVGVVETPHKLAIRLHAEDQRIHFDVIDNGIGIAPEQLPRLFQHGFSTKPNGHGFGLHASAMVARTMNGALVAHSEGLGRGARFRLTLPRLSAT